VSVAGFGKTQSPVPAPEEGECCPPVTKVLITYACTVYVGGLLGCQSVIQLHMAAWLSSAS